MPSKAMLPVMWYCELPCYTIVNSTTPYDAMLFLGMLGNRLPATTWYHRNGTCYQPLGLVNGAIATGNIHWTTRYHISESKSLIFHTFSSAFDGLHRRQSWRTSWPYHWGGRRGHWALEHIYIYIYICICIYIYVYVYIYMHMYVCIYMYVYVNMYMYIYIYVYVCMYVYIYTYIWMRHTYTYTYVYIYIYIDMCMCVCTCLHKCMLYVSMLAI